MSRYVIAVLIACAAMAAVSRGSWKSDERADELVSDATSPLHAEPREELQSKRFGYSLVLTGTVAASNASRGYALIREGDAPPQLVPVGSIVVPSVTLVAVHADHVLLDVDGQERALWLTASGSSATPAVPSADERRDLDEMFSARYSYEDGVHRGFTVFAGRDPRWMGRLSLLPGDLIIAINGEPLDQPDSGAVRLASLRNLDVADVTIVRFEEPQTMRVKIKGGDVLDPADGEVSTVAEMEVAVDETTLP